MNKKTIRIAGDTWELRRCPYCGSEDIIGHGVQHNGSHPKRKKCKACGRTFNLRIPCGLPQGDLVKYIKISGAAKQHHLGVIPCGLATGIVKVKEIFYYEEGNHFL